MQNQKSESRGAHTYLQDVYWCIGKDNFRESPQKHVKKNLKSKIPITVKVSPDIKNHEIDPISEVLLNNNIEAIIVSNTSDSTRDELKNIQSHQKGGLSGKPIELKSTKLINKFYIY